MDLFFRFIKILYHKMTAQKTSFAPVDQSLFCFVLKFMVVVCSGLTLYHIPSICFLLAELFLVCVIKHAVSTSSSKYVKSPLSPEQRLGTPGPLV